MRWLLVGLCGLAWVNLSAPVPKDPHITQTPRFYGVRAKRNVSIQCLFELPQPHTVDWFLVKNSDLKTENPVSHKGFIKGETSYLLLNEVTPSDSGVYYCKVNGFRGPGTGLEVMERPFNVSTAEKRSAMKDALIVLQALMLASCIAAPLVQKYMLAKKDEAIYEDPQQDHTYEGLVVETCEGALYEDISSYAQTGGPEAPWEN